MGALIVGLIIGICAGIASWFLQQKLEGATKEKEAALQQQRTVLEGDREMRLRAATQALQNDYNRQLAAKESEWQAKYSALEAQESEWQAKYSALEAKESDWQAKYSALEAKESEWQAKYSALEAQRQQPIESLNPPAATPVTTGAAEEPLESYNPLLDLLEEEESLEASPDLETPITPSDAMAVESPREETEEIKKTEETEEQFSEPEPPLEIVQATAAEGVEKTGTVESTLASLANLPRIRNACFFKPYLRHRHPEVREAAAKALGHFVEKKSLRAELEPTLQMLGQLLGDSSAAVRARAVESAGKIRSERAIPLLERGRRDSSREVIKAASDAIARFRVYPRKKPPQAPLQGTRGGKKKNR